MSTRNFRGTLESAAGHADDIGASPMKMMTDLPRRQLAMLSQSASAWYRGSETVRQIQLQSAQRASQQHQQAMERLRGSRDFGEVLSIQTELLRFNLQESAHYWQQMASALLQVQSEMISGAGEVLDPAAEPTLAALQRAFAQTLNGGATAEAPTH